MGLHERGRATPTVSLADLLEGNRPAVQGQCSFSLADYVEAITSSGLPGILTSPEQLRIAHLDAYLQRIGERELPDQGLAIRRPGTFRRWLTAYAAASSTTTSHSKIIRMATAGDGSQPAKTTTIAYRDHLMQLWLLDPVPGWSHSRSDFTQLQQAPKHQLADPALAARLLNLTSNTLLSPRGAAMTGPLFEALATLTVRVAAQASGAIIGHLRTARGDREIDLIVEGNQGQVIGIEVKLASTVNDDDVKHLIWLREQLPDDVIDVVVLSTGNHAYRRPDGVAVVPLGLLGA